MERKTGSMIGIVIIGVQEALRQKLITTAADIRIPRRMQKRILRRIRRRIHVRNQRRITRRTPKEIITIIGRREALVERTKLMHKSRKREMQLSRERQNLARFSDLQSTIIS